MTDYVTEKDILFDIIKLYHQNRCLWDTNERMYRSRQARLDAYKGLLERFKAIDPDAELDAVKCKLENMRTSFFRQWKKASRVLLIIRYLYYPTTDTRRLRSSYKYYGRFKRRRVFIIAQVTLRSSNRLIFTFTYIDHDVLRNAI